MRDATMNHMRCWVGLAQHTLNKEFPSFDFVQAMSAFDLRTRGGGVPRRRQLVLTPSLELKLRRLATAFKMPSLRREYVDRWCIAAKVVDETNGRSPSWDAWASAIAQIQHVRSGCRWNAQSRYVVQFGMCFLPVTSGIENLSRALQVSLATGGSMLPWRRSSGPSGCWSLTSHLLKSPAWGQRRRRCGPPCSPSNTRGRTSASGLTRACAAASTPRPNRPQGSNPRRSHSSSAFAPKLDHALLLR